MSVTIIVPKRARSTDALESGLVRLTEAIFRVNPELVAQGLLGGEFGYGGDWNNNTLQMHPYCWCEEPTCPWCGGCTCPDSAFHYFVDGTEVTSAEWLDFYEREVGRIDFASASRAEIRANNALSDAANARRSERHDRVCDYCTGKTPHADKGAVPGRSAPNFWHKPSGLRVWWYKWIGRGMEIVGPRPLPDYAAMIRECIDSLPASSPANHSEAEGQ